MMETPSHPENLDTARALPTVLVCPGSPLEISRMLAACPDLAGRCRMVWWGRSPRIGEKIRAEVPDARVMACLHRGATRSSLWKGASFEAWVHHALRWEEVLAARAGQTLDSNFYALAASQVAEAVRVLALVRPDAILIKAGTRLHEAAFSAVARGLGVPCLYTERGAFPGSLFLDAHGVGPEMRPAGEKPAPEFLTAAEDYLRGYRQDAQSAWQQPQRRGGEQLRRDLGVGPRQRLLFYAAQVENDANMVLYSPHFASNNAFLRFVMRALEGLPDTVVVAKPHPKEAIPLQNEKPGSRSRLIIRRDINIKDILPQADAVLSLNSTVGFEALLYDKPVACGASSYYSHRGWTFDVASPSDTVPLHEWLRQPQLSLVQQAAFVAFSHQLLAGNLYFEQPAPGLHGPAQYLQKILAAPRHAYSVDPWLVHRAEQILAGAGASYENLSTARRLGESWRRVKVKLKR